MIENLIVCIYFYLKNIITVVLDFSNLVLFMLKKDTHWYKTKNTKQQVLM